MLRNAFSTNKLLAMTDDFFDNIEADSPSTVKISSQRNINLDGVGGEESCLKIHVLAEEVEQMSLTAPQICDTEESGKQNRCPDCRLPDNNVVSHPKGAECRSKNYTEVDRKISPNAENSDALRRNNHNSENVPRIYNSESSSEAKDERKSIPGCSLLKEFSGLTYDKDQPESLPLSASSHQMVGLTWMNWYRIKYEEERMRRKKETIRMKKRRKEKKAEEDRKRDNDIKVKTAVKEWLSRKQEEYKKLERERQKLKTEKEQQRLRIMKARENVLRAKRERGNFVKFLKGTTSRREALESSRFADEKCRTSSDPCIWMQRHRLELQFYKCPPKHLDYACTNGRVIPYYNRTRLPSPAFANSVPWRN